MSDHALREEYEKRYAFLEQLKEVVEHISRRVLSRKKINYHIVLGRVKDFDSFQDKILRKGFSDPFNDVKDLVGVRVVCLFRPEVEEVANIIKDTFTILEEDNQMEGTSPDNFGYMAFHLKAKLKDSQVDTSHEEIKNVPFEVQIRTIAQDAWAAISHYLDYKKESDIPARLKRDFHALSGLFYVADVHFSMLGEEKAKNIGEDL